MFIMDKASVARMADTGKLDIKKLGEMWRNLNESERDVSMRPWQVNSTPGKPLSMTIIN